MFNSYAASELAEMLPTNQARKLGIADCPARRPVRYKYISQLQKSKIA